MVSTIGELVVLMVAMNRTSEECKCLFVDYLMA